MHNLLILQASKQLFAQAVIGPQKAKTYAVDTSYYRHPRPEALVTLFVLVENIS